METVIQRFSYRQGKREVTWCNPILSPMHFHHTMTQPNGKIKKMLLRPFILSWTVVIGFVLAAVIAGSLRAENSLAENPTSTPTALAKLPATLPAMKSTTIDGRVVPLGAESNRPSVVIFLGMECPISRWYIPALNDMSHKVADENVDLYGVISDRSATPAAVLKFAADYQIKICAHDPQNRHPRR
jgi:hypothetical protein